MSDNPNGIEIIILPPKPSNGAHGPARIARPAARSTPPAPKGGPDLGLQGLRIVLVVLLMISVGYFAHRLSRPTDEPVVKEDEPAKPLPPPVEEKKDPPSKPYVAVTPPPAVRPEPPPVKMEEPLVVTRPEPDPKEMEFSTLVADSDALMPFDPPAAAEKARKALEIRPDRADLWKRVGDVVHAAGNRDAAYLAWTKSVEADAAQPTLLNNLGVIDLQAGRLDGAERRFDAALALGVTAVLCHNFGNLNLARQELSKAVHFYRRAIELEPAHGPSKYNLALVLEKQGRAAEAAGLLASLGAEFPDAPIHRARLEAGLGGPAADRAMNEARQGRDAALALAVADGFRKAGENEKALAMLDHALDLAPQDVKTLLNRGAIRHGMGRLDAAVQDYEAALKLDGKLAQAHYNLGLVAEERKQYVQALEQYAAALKIDSRMAVAHNNIGVLYLKVSQPAKAIECFRRAVEADAAFAASRLNLAWAWLGRSEPEKALDEFKAYAALVPADQRDPQAMKAMARLQEK